MSSQNTHNLRSKGKIEPAKRAPASKAAVKDKSTKASSSASKSTGRKQVREDSISENSKGEYTKDNEKAFKQLKAKFDRASKKKEANQKVSKSDYLPTMLQSHLE